MSKIEHEKAKCPKFSVKWPKNVASQLLSNDLFVYWLCCCCVKTRLLGLAMLVKVLTKTKETQSTDPKELSRCCFKNISLLSLPKKMKILPFWYTFVLEKLEVKTPPRGVAFDVTMGRQSRHAWPEWWCWVVDGLLLGSFLTLAKAFVSTVKWSPYRIKKARVDGRKFRHGMLLYWASDLSLWLCTM